MVKKQTVSFKLNGADVDVAVSRANALHVENYAGVSYYFCCDGCWTTFLKDPGEYAAIHQISAGAVPAATHPHATD